MICKQVLLSEFYGSNLAQMVFKIYNLKTKIINLTG